MKNGRLLSVTDLCAYKFCPRTLYIKLVLGLREPTKPVMLLGSIRHKVFEEANNKEKDLMELTSSGMKRQDILKMFSNAYDALLNKSVYLYASQLQALGMDKNEIAEQMRPAVYRQAEERADEIFSFAEKNDVFGKQLWEKFTPKIISELKVSSDNLKLKGIIDRIEDHGSEYVPVEIKTGRVPSQGVWPDHRLQVAAYMMLLKEKFNVQIKEGLVKYVKENKERQIVFNPFMEHEVLQVRDDVFSLIEQKGLPNDCGKSYCTVCSYGDDFEMHLVKGYRN